MQLLRTDVSGNGRSFMYQCHSILWTPSKLYGKNHILIVLVNCHTHASSKVIFNDLLIENVHLSFIEREELAWIAKEFVTQNNILFQLLERMPRWTYQDYKMTINCIFCSFTWKQLVSNWYTQNELEKKIQSIANFSTS